MRSEIRVLKRSLGRHYETFLDTNDTSDTTIGEEKEEGEYISMEKKKCNGTNRTETK